MFIRAAIFAMLAIWFAACGSATDSENHSSTALSQRGHAAGSLSFQLTLQCPEQAKYFISLTAKHKSGGVSRFNAYKPSGVYGHSYGGHFSQHISGYEFRDFYSKIKDPIVSMQLKLYHEYMWFPNQVVAQLDLPNLLAKRTASSAGLVTQESLKAFRQAVEKSSDAKGCRVANFQVQ